MRVLELPAPPFPGDPPGGTLAREEACYRATFDQAAVGIGHTDRDGRFINVNEKLCSLLGYPREELLQRRYQDVTHPEDVGQNEAIREALLRDGHRSTCGAWEKRFVRKDGAVLWASIAVSVVRDDPGSPPYFVSVVQDISARLDAQAHFRATFEQAAVGIAHMSLDGRYLRVNRKLCDLLGYTQAELLGKTARDVSHPDDYEAGLARRKKLLSGEAAEISAEKRYLRKDGAIVYANRSASVVRGPDGEPRYILALVTDITAQKLAEQVLRESEQRFRAIFDHSAVGISMRPALDRAQRWTHVNDAFCRMLGYTREELLQLSTRDITPPEEQDKAERDNERLRRGEVPGYGREKRLRRKDGSLIWVQLAVAALPDERGHPRDVIAVYQDITARKRAEEALRESERFARSIIDALSKHICVLDETGTIVAINKAWRDFARANGAPAARVCEGANYLAVCDAAAAAGAAEARAFAAGIRAVLNGERDAFTTEYPCHAPGEERWFVGRVSRFGGDGPKRVVVSHDNITGRKRAERALAESEEKFRQLAEHIPQVFWMTDADQKRLIYASPAYERVTGHTLAELQADPRSWLDTIHEEDRDRVRLARRREASGGGYDIEYRVVHADGTVRWIHDRAFPVRDATGRVYRIAGIGEDITERKQAEARLVQLAHYDALTGLPNRALFNDRLQQTLQQARRDDWIVGVLFLDLDRFKLVNDTLGHAFGDCLLRQVSERIGQCLRPGDIAGRLGGDEFAVILPGLAEPQNAGLVAERILKALALPFDLDGAETYVSASIGIALYPADGEDGDALMRNADAAMYGAKQLGRNNCQYYTAEMNERATAKLQLETRLRRALERGEFLLHFQPRTSIASGEIAGLEALLRWRPPGNGLVPPGDFIPLLEETGLIVPVGEWVVRAACAQIGAWRDAGLEPAPVAINVSARQLAQKDFCETLGRALAEHAVEPRWIEIEITESSLMQNPEDAVTLLRRIRALGIRLAVDDFGTGYSSLGYLKRLPLDALKIDRSFIRDTTTNPDDAAITRTVTALAHALGLKVVAEGVETQDQLAFLGEIGCDEAQGFLLSPPVPAGECAGLLSGRRRLHAPAAAAGVAGRGTVLLMDDDADHLLLLQRLLRDEGCTVLAATSPRQGFDLLATHKVDVIVSDQRMPDGGGVEFLKRARLMYPGAKRIMFSSSGDFQTVTAAINLGEVHKFFVKGRDEELLRAEIRKLAGARRPAGG
jgi:diguanylate cyclase (GGDEF)-like protein/PAS domain S-box-containing protein